MTVDKLITDHIDIWSSALQTRSTAGRGSRGKIDLYGIKKLRELILELAVRGKLVPQDPNDEPASELLKRIAAEKAELVRQGKIKKQKPLPEISEDEKPFELPGGWEWVRLGHICTKLTDGSHNPPKDNGSGYPMLSSQNIQNGQIEIDNPSRFVCREGFIKENSRTLIKKGDVLLTIVGSLGRSAVVINDTEFVLQRSVAVLTSGLLPSYLSDYFKSITAQLFFLENGKGTAQKGIYLGQLSQMLIPVPSFIEQKQIVSKINELMSLCDQLEQQSLTSLEAHQQLVEILLTTLTNSLNAEELTENWARISQYFDTLFTTEASIDALKQTILQLAVMGKLVPQDPNDEPASELLKRIEQEKAQLVKEGKIKKQKLLPPVSDDEKIFSLPKGWEWVRLDDICFGITSGSTPAKEIFNEVEGIPYLKVYNIKSQKIDFDYKPQFINERYNDEKMKRSTLYPGDVVMNIVGPPLGKVAIIPDAYDKWNCNQAIVFFRSIEKSIGDYIYVYLLAAMFLDSIELIGTAGQDNISVTKSRSIVLPLPPKNEQQKIKKMVEKMLHNCDILKSRLQSAQQTQLHLADALTDAALN